MKRNNGWNVLREIESFENQNNDLKFGEDLRIILTSFCGNKVLKKKYFYRRIYQL